MKEIISELEERNSVLSQIPKKYYADTASIPSGYFEGMEDRFFANISANQMPRATSVSIWQRISTPARVAAMLALTALGIVLFRQLDSSENISNNELMSYLQDEGYTVETKKYSENEIKQNHLDKLSEDEICQYLNEVEGIDVCKI